MASYIAVTAHYINSSWALQEELVAFKYVRGAHSGENLANIVLAALEDLGIVGKV